VRLLKAFGLGALLVGLLGLFCGGILGLAFGILWLMVKLGIWVFPVLLGLTLLALVTGAIYQDIE
jgi:hypothetical protein